MLEVRNLQRTSEAYPAQWEGTCGERGGVYIRYRGGWVSVYYSPHSLDGLDGEEIFECQHGGKYDGIMDTATMKELVKAVCHFAGS